MSAARPWTWFRAFAGRGLMRRGGHFLTATFIERPDLAAEGELIPVGLAIEIRTRPLTVRLRCDADEIATRIAARAGA